VACSVYGHHRLITESSAGVARAFANNRDQRLNPDPPLRIRHLRQPVSDVAVDAILPVLVEIAVVLNMSLGQCRTHAMAEGDQGRPACSARMMSASCLRSAVMSAVLSDCEKPPAFSRSEYSAGSTALPSIGPALTRHVVFSDRDRRRIKASLTMSGHPPTI
jgi:hypothetical protein